MASEVRATFELRPSLKDANRDDKAYGRSASQGEYALASARPNARALFWGDQECPLCVEDPKPPHVEKTYRTFKNQLIQQGRVHQRE